MSFATTLDYTSYANRSSDLAGEIQKHLDAEGCVLIKQFPADLVEGSTLFEALCNSIGTPIPHDAHGSIVWDIKSRPTSDTGVITYSEHNHEAEMHTDSQYSETPEDYFGLLTLLPASCGGGESMLLNVEDIVRELRNTPQGEIHENALRSGNYPFLVPKVFQRGTGAIAEYNAGPILRDREIRFRVDTLEKALVAYPNLCSQVEKDAYFALKQIVLNSSSLRRFHLEKGDLIFINNKTMLHGRTSFSDHNRHLLRIRFNRRPN